MNNQVKKFPEELLPDDYSSTPGIIYTTPEVQEEENPNGEVKTYLLPEVFDWVKEKKSGVRKDAYYPWAAMRKKRFTINECAAQVFDLKPGDKIKFGVSKKYLLIAKDEGSDIVVNSNAIWDTKKLESGEKEYISLTTGSISYLKKILAKNDWPETFTIPVELQGYMLVGKKPASSLGTGCEPGEEKQEKIHPWRSKPMSKEEFREKILANKGECRR